MNRNRQVNSVHMLDQRLVERRALLSKSYAQLRTRLHALNPTLLAGGGVIAGVALHRLGLRSAYAIAMFSYRYFYDTGTQSGKASLANDRLPTAQ